MLDARQENPTGYAGWVMGIEKTGGSQEATISPSDTKTTMGGGSINEPWNILFTASDQNIAVQINEDHYAGYQFVDGACTITPRVGETVHVDITSESVVLGDAGAGAHNRNLRPGDEVECEFRNQPLPGSVSWQKINEATPADHLAGSEWGLSGPGVPPNTVITDCIAESATECDDGPFADRDPRAGYFELTDLSKGNHTITEITPPPGYVIDEADNLHRFVVEIIGDENVDCKASEANGVPKCLHIDFDEPFVNKMGGAPPLPLTGGLSTDAYTIAGLILFALGAVGITIYTTKRKENA